MEGATSRNEEFSNYLPAVCGTSFVKGVQALQQPFNLSHSEAMFSCSDCHMTHISQYYGTKSRGLLPLQEWQNNVTKIPEFGRFKYVHVMADTFSHSMIASAFTEETARDAVCHFCHAFSILGVPSHIKTDNAPVYVSQKLQMFFHAWGVDHSTGTPHVPMGQAII